MQRFNHQYRCTQKWEAHKGLVLASAISVYRGRRIYITGGNDNDVAIWDITEVNEEHNDGLSDNNGEVVDA